MTLQCIGKSRDSHGNISQCGHTSDTPNDPRWPEMFLCGACSGAAPNKLSRPQYKVEVEDTDPPSYDENDGADDDVIAFLERSEQDDFDTLQELDLIF